MFRLVFCLLLCCFAVAFVSAANINRPVIGVLTQPSDEGLYKFGPTYIAASYVKYIESGGAQAVPIRFDAPVEELQFVFSQINGVLFPGGGSDLDNTTLYNAGKALYNMALEANDNGDYFVVFGHCQGFELLNMITSQNLTILGTNYNSENLTLPLNFTENALRSKMFAEAPGDVIHILANQPVTMNNHEDGVSYESWFNNAYLPDFYNILSWNLDRDGQNFISTMEGKDYPVYGIQWHAEKPQFEWDVDECVNHSPDAILAMQYMQRFLVNEARKSTHQFKSQELLDSMLIYNFKLEYTEPYSSFEECYFFDRWNYTMSLLH